MAPSRIKSTSLLLLTVSTDCPYVSELIGRGTTKNRASQFPSINALFWRKMTETKHELAYP